MKSTVTIRIPVVYEVLPEALCPEFPACKSWPWTAADFEGLQTNEYIFDSVCLFC